MLRQYYKKRFGVEVGKHSYGMDFSNIAQGTKIGAFCSIASGVKIGLMNHPMQYVSTNPFLPPAAGAYLHPHRDNPHPGPADFSWTQALRPSS